MRREGSALSGVGAVVLKELSDNLASTRMRLLEGLIFLTGAGAVYSTIGAVKATVGQDRFVFLHVFTNAHDPLPSFVGFLGFLVPIVAIALGFDSVDGEFNRGTMSRILAQPIYRDALLFGKFLAGLATLAIVLTALWLFVAGLGILMLGLPPSTEEALRGFAFLVSAIAYGGVWLALAMTFSVLFRAPATAALASLAVWLVFAFFWQMLVQIATPLLAPPDPYNPASLIHTVNIGLDLARLSPNTLFAEATVAFLDPAQRALGLVLPTQLQGAVNAPLPFGESLALAWPMVTGLIAGLILLLTLAYVLFQRQEVRA